MAQLAVHKKKIEEVSTWFNQFPQNRKVCIDSNFADVEITCDLWSGRGSQVYRRSVFDQQLGLENSRMDKPYRRK